jgi:ParB family transcriptional regulator, chromosome partitioning protein
MIKSIPLNKLVPSPRNVRRHSDPAADVELKASIAACGLLQNLIVRPGAKGKFEVEAGERRRKAMVALADDKVLARDFEVTCLVLEDSSEAAVETSLAENFHRLAMNPADEAQAFASLVAGGASAEEVARRFGLTVRLVEGRLRLASLAPLVFDALAAGEITLDIAKAFGATSDHEIQTRVFEQVSSGYYAPSADSIRRMVLSGTVRGSDPRARLVGRDAYLDAGGRIERELFDDDDSESWVDVALLESLAAAKMEEQAKQLAAQQGLAWVRPTLDPYASHDLVEGLVRLPAEPAPLTEAELARLDVLDASYDEHAAILEDEESADEAVAAAEAAIEAIERECQNIRARPPVLDPELKAEAGMILVLGRDGTPVLQPVFYGERQVEAGDDGDMIEVVPGDGSTGSRRAALSKRLVDELAMQRRDVLALHLASDPGLALDLMVFTLADADTHDWRARPVTTLRGSAPAGPIIGFEAKDAPASAGLAELRSGLDESWRAGADVAARFDLFRALPDDSRAAWLGFVVARSLEAGLNMAGDRKLAFQDHLGGLIGIDMAQWWRPSAANYFDRVSKQVILDALTDVGGLELSSRFAAVKKGDLAMSAERVFAGTYITEVEVREKALAWVPEVMRFAAAPGEDTGNEPDEGNDEIGTDDHDCDLSPSELAA